MTTLSNWWIRSGDEIAGVKQWLVVLCLSFFREIPINMFIVLLLAGGGVRRNDSATGCPASALNTLK